MAMVLLAGADPDKSVRLKKALEAAGYEVSVASNGSSAVAMVRQRRPDLIVSQTMLDDMYGSELCSMIQADSTTKGIMFVLLVDRASQMAMAATRTDADMILPESSPPSNIVARVDTHLRLRGFVSTPPPRAAGEEAAPKAAKEESASTLQGSLAIMDLTEVTQAISIGRKTGRLVLSLATGMGVVLFQSGRPVHAEYAGKTGEEAFIALVMTAHRERGGSFSFLPFGGGEASDLPQTIRKDLETLLLNIAVEIDENQRGTGS